MTKSELDKLRFSAVYLEQLIQGKHPNTGDVVFDPKDKANLGLVNCLMFVHQYITKEIEASKTVLRDFALTEQSLRSIPISNEGLSITQFTENINEHAKEPDMNRLRGRQITGWLIKNGYMEYRTLDGKDFRCPTKKGNDVGISSYEYVSNGARYIMNIYSDRAQKFILENMEYIVKGEKIEE